MIHADEIRNNHSEIAFPLAAPKPMRLRTKTEVSADEAAEPSRLNELDLSGFQVLVGMSALSAVGFSMWALLKLWLFEM